MRDEPVGARLSEKLFLDASEADVRVGDDVEQAMDASGVVVEFGVDGVPHHEVRDIERPLSVGKEDAHSRTEFLVVREHALVVGFGFEDASAQPGGNVGGSAPVEQRIEFGGTEVVNPRHGVVRREADAAPEDGSDRPHPVVGAYCVHRIVPRERGRPDAGELDQKHLLGVIERLAVAEDGPFGRREANDDRQVVHGLVRYRGGDPLFDGGGVRGVNVIFKFSEAIVQHRAIMAHCRCLGKAFRGSKGMRGI